MASPTPDKSVKQFWQGVVDENMLGLRDSLLEASQAERDVWITCPHCNHRSQIPVPDARARTDAVKALHALAGELPKADSAAASGAAGFILKRVLVMPDGRQVELKEGQALPSSEQKELTNGE